MQNESTLLPLIVIVYGHNNQSTVQGNSLHCEDDLLLNFKHLKPKECSSSESIKVNQLYSDVKICHDEM